MLARCCQIEPKLIFNWFKTSSLLATNPLEAKQAPDLCLFPDMNASGRVLDQKLWWFLKLFIHLNFSEERTATVRWNPSRRALKMGSALSRAVLDWEWSQSVCRQPCVLHCGEKLWDFHTFRHLPGLIWFLTLSRLATISHSPLRNA